MCCELATLPRNHQPSHQGRVKAIMVTQPDTSPTVSYNFYFKLYTRNTQSIRLLLEKRERGAFLSTARVSETRSKRRLWRPNEQKTPHKKSFLITSREHSGIKILDRVKRRKILTIPMENR
jgi:hypothetical protein